MFGKRFVLALAGGLFYCLCSACELGAQDSVRFTHHFAVPDTSVRVSPILPRVSEFIPTYQYERWWQEIAACEKLELPILHVRIRFFQVNAVHFYDQDKPSLFWKDGILMVHYAIGQSYLAEGAIFLALPYRATESVVKHEMLHFLIYWNGIPPGRNLHPIPYFAQCGMTVEYKGPKKT